VAYLLKARTAQPEKKQLLSNSGVTRNNGIIVGGGVSYVVGAEAI
jgi:hypothetical protein